MYIRVYTCKYMPFTSYIKTSHTPLAPLYTPSYWVFYQDALSCSYNLFVACLALRQEYVLEQLILASLSSLAGCCLRIKSSSQLTGSCCELCTAQLETFKKMMFYHFPLKVRLSVCLPPQKRQFSAELDCQMF